MSSALEGCTIVIAVDRRSSELTAALERHGAQVIRAPALTIESHIDDDVLLERTRSLIADPPDIVVATTGVGFRAWFEAADEAGLAGDLEQALQGSRIVARGPKARGAIQQAGLTADWVAESETAAELGAYLVAGGVTGKRIAVQHHGSGADGLDQLFATHGADIVSLTVYRWGPPADPEVVRQSVQATADGEVDAVMFTSAPGAREWLAEARRGAVLDRIRNRAVSGSLVMAAVGPITAEPLRALAVPAMVAERGRLGSLVRTVVTHFGGGHAPGVVTPHGRLEPRSSGAVLNGTYLALSPTGTAMLSALVRAAGSVVSRDELLECLPRSSQNAHAVEMAVARLRAALGEPGLVETVVKRGYRLLVQEA